MKHPLPSITRPLKYPDFQSNSIVVWFDDMIIGISNSNLEWEYAKLAICPLSGMLMYMTRYYPISWNIIETDTAWNKPLYEAYETYLVERNLLGKQYGQ